MAICTYCKSEMLKAAGCAANTSVRFAKKTMPPVLYGADRDGRCGDCGVKPGNAHHPGCDMERCPQCKGQIISCSCGGK